MSENEKEIKEENLKEKKPKQKKKKRKLRKRDIFMLIILGIIFIAMSNNRLEETKTAQTQPPSLEDIAKMHNKEVKKIKNEYLEKMTLLYINYYPKYSPVRCEDTSYKGYLFIKCFSVRGDGTIGGLWVVDNTKTNEDGGFDIYAINGKALTQREAIFKNAGREYKDIKEIPLPMVKWIKIDEVHELIDNNKNYKGKYKKEPLY